MGQVLIVGPIVSLRTSEKHEKHNNNNKLVQNAHFTAFNQVSDGLVEQT